MKNQEVREKVQEYLYQLHGILNSGDTLDFANPLADQHANALLKFIECDFAESLQSDVSVSDEELPSLDFFISQQREAFRHFDTKCFYEDLHQWSFGKGFEYGCKYVYKWMRDKLQPKKD